MINILPYSQKKAVYRMRVFRVLTVIFCGGTALLVIGSFLFFPTLMTINSRFALVDGQVTKLKEDGALPETIDIAGLKTRTIAVAAKLAAPIPPPPMQYIETVRSVAGNGVVVAGFSMQQIDTPTLEVTGVTTNRAALQRFIAQLEKNPTVVSVVSPISNFVKSTSSSFTVTVTFK